MSTSTASFLRDLRDEIDTHPAVNHLFLNRLATTPFSREDYGVFARHHFPLVCVFTSYLEALLVRAPESSDKLWIAKVLVDEYGEGTDGHDHATMYAKFMESAGRDRKVVTADTVPKPAFDFVRRHRRLVRERPFLEGLGAVGPGHEWAIPKMFDAVIPGLRRAGFSEQEIAYFTVHIEQDQDHGAWLEEALARYATSEQARREIRAGALASLEARSTFWDGVQAAVTRFRQPRSARVDGVHRRPVLWELTLTFWDGMRVSHWVNRKLDNYSAKRRASLAEAITKTREL